jgi:hypothetical protein
MSNYASMKFGGIWANGFSVKQFLSFPILTQGTHGPAMGESFRTFLLMK